MLVLSSEFGARSGFWVWDAEERYKRIHGSINISSVENLNFFSCLERSHPDSFPVARARSYIHNNKIPVPGPAAIKDKITWKRGIDRMELPHHSIGKSLARHL